MSKKSLVQKLLDAFSDPNAKKNGYDLSLLKMSLLKTNDSIISRCYEYKFLKKGIDNPTDMDIIKELTRIRGESQVLKILKLLGKSKKDLDRMNNGFNIIVPIEDSIIVFGSPDSTDIDVAIILYSDDIIEYDITLGKFEGLCF